MGCHAFIQLEVLSHPFTYLRTWYLFTFEIHQLLLKPRDHLALLPLQLRLQCKLLVLPIAYTD